MLLSVLQTRLPFKNKLLESLGCLNPKKISKSKPTDIEFIAKKLCVSDDLVLRATDEWKVLTLDQSVQAIDFKRVDHFWREVFSQVSTDSSRKYSALTDVIKMALLLPHGNADVERGLSINNSIVTKERNQLSETTINGLKGTKDAVKFYDPEKMRLEKLLITKHVLSSARNAHFDYQRRLDIQREKEEKERKELLQRREEDERRKKARDELLYQKATLSEKQLSLDEEEKEIKESLTSAYDLLKEGNEKMKAAIAKKDLTKISTAQLMIDTATNKTGEYNATLDKIRVKQKDLDQRKRKLLDSSLDLQSQQGNKKKKTDK